jgi:hypothetical protein
MSHALRVANDGVAGHGDGVDHGRRKDARFASRPRKWRALWPIITPAQSVAAVKAHGITPALHARNASHFSTTDAALVLQYRPRALEFERIDEKADSGRNKDRPRCAGSFR